VYGAATFVSSLIENRLIDELNFFVNPVADRQRDAGLQRSRTMKLTASTAYPCGIVVNSYQPKVVLSNMSKLRVITFAISLDGYGAGPNQGMETRWALEVWLSMNGS